MLPRRLMRSGHEQRAAVLRRAVRSAEYRLRMIVLAPAETKPAAIHRCAHGRVAQHKLLAVIVRHGAQPRFNVLHKGRFGHGVHGHARHVEENAEALHVAQQRVEAINAQRKRRHDCPPSVRRRFIFA